MNDKNLSLFEKGSFKAINNGFILDGYQALNELEGLQQRYEKKDMDTLLNELHDSMVGYYLGFSLVNVEKHGFDCKYSENQNIYLESKVASFSSNAWNATFNDTTYEKAMAFGDKKVWLALSVWESASKLLCICFGQNEGIEKFLQDKIDRFKEGKVVRSTQSLTFSSLVFQYKFKILSISKSSEDLLRILSLKNKNLKKLDIKSIIPLNEFQPDKFFLGKV